MLQMLQVKVFRVQPLPREAGAGGQPGAREPARGPAGGPGPEWGGWPVSVSILTSVPGFCHPYGTIAIQVDDV